MTASGCGAMVKEYGELLHDDPRYADKAARVAALSKDLSEVLRDADLAVLARDIRKPQRVAFHAPCTLQHAQQLGGTVEDILRRLGFVLAAVPDAHLCCGSAGTYSILQPVLSQRLLTNKLAALGRASAANRCTFAAPVVRCRRALHFRAPAILRRYAKGDTRARARGRIHLQRTTD